MVFFLFLLDRQEKMGAFMGERENEELRERREMRDEGKQAAREKEKNAI